MVRTTGSAEDCRYGANLWLEVTAISKLSGSVGNLWLEVTAMSKLSGSVGVAGVLPVAFLMLCKTFPLSK